MGDWKHDESEDLEDQVTTDWQLDAGDLVMLAGHPKETSSI